MQKPPKFLANENFMAAGVRVLRNAGLDVVFIAEESPSIKDWQVTNLAIASDRIILTHDRDYGELVFKHGYRPTAGVIYFRMKNYLPEEPAKVLLTLLEDAGFNYTGIYTVVDNDGEVRQRAIPAAD